MQTASVAYLLIIFLVKLCLSQKSICGPLYPAVLGGSTGETIPQSMEMINLYYTIVGGYTKDQAVTGTATAPINNVGFIALYSYEKMKPQWIKSLP